MGSVADDRTRFDDRSGVAEHGMRYAYRLALHRSVLGAVFSIAVGLVILYAFICPYGAGRTWPFHQRLFFHALCGVLGIVACYPASVVTLYLARYQTRTRIGLALAGQCLVTALPGAAVPYTLYGLFHEGALPDEGLLLTYLVSAATLLGAGTVAYYVLCLVSHDQSTAIPESSGVAFGRAVRRQTVAAVATTTVPPGLGPEASAMALDKPRTDGSTAAGSAAAEDPRPAVSGRRAVTERTRLPASIDYPAKPRPSGGLLTRIPRNLGRDLVYIKVSGHYLEVVTTAGSAVIVQRFSDAVAELGDHGLQIHRSYWVAHEHIRHVLRRDHRTLLHLTGGFEVPVSRTFLPAVHHLAANRAGSPARGSGTD